MNDCRSDTRRRHSSWAVRSFADVIARRLFAAESEKQSGFALAECVVDKRNCVLDGGLCCGERLRGVQERSEDLLLRAVSEHCALCADATFFLQ